VLARIRGESQVTWQTLLEAVAFHVTTAPVGELSDYDAERLIAAGNDILIRLQEAKDKGVGRQGVGRGD
jgi:hypothetical protein